MELKFQVLSRLDVKSFLNAMYVSTQWLQLCNYPLIWKLLFLNEQWSVDADAMLTFETKLQELQMKFDYHAHRFLTRASVLDKPEVSLDPDPEVENGMDIEDRTDFDIHYDRFFAGLHIALDAPKPYFALKPLKALFQFIAFREMGEPYARTTCFTPKGNGSIELHVDWRYLYLQHRNLEKNWRNGHFQATVINGAPDVPQPHLREGIYCVHFDRRRIATGARDRAIRLWDMDTLSYVGKLEGHQGSVLCLQIDSKRGVVVSGSSDSRVKIWCLKENKCVKTLQGHTSSVLGLAFNDEYLVTCSKDSTAVIWGLDEERRRKCADKDDLSTRMSRYTSLHVLKGHRAAVNAVHLHRDVIATASGDRTVRLWNVQTGDMVRTITNHVRGIACVYVRNQLLVTGSSDHVIKIFRLPDGVEIQNLKGHNGLVRTIEMDGSKIISGSYDQSIKIWDLQTGCLLQDLRGHHESKYASISSDHRLTCRIFRVHHDQKRIMSCCGNSKLVVWDFSRPAADQSGSTRTGIPVDAFFF